MQRGVNGLAVGLAVRIAFNGSYSSLHARNARNARNACTAMAGMAGMVGMAVKVCMSMDANAHARHPDIRFGETCLRKAHTCTSSRSKIKSRPSLSASSGRHTNSCTGTGSVSQAAAKTTESSKPRDGQFDEFDATLSTWPLHFCHHDAQSRCHLPHAVLGQCVFAMLDGFHAFHPLLPCLAVAWTRGKSHAMPGSQSTDEKTLKGKAIWLRAYEGLKWTSTASDLTRQLCAMATG